MTFSAPPEKTDSHEQAFIMTIRKALGKPVKSVKPDPAKLFGTPPSDLKNRLKTYTQKPRSDQKRRLDLFIEQAGPINLQVNPVKDVSRAGIAIRKLIQQTTPEWGRQKSVMAWQHPLIDRLGLEKTLGRDDVTLFTTRTSSTPDSSQRKKIRRQLLSSYIGITSADFCVAGSATLVMRTRPGQPRAVSLVPSIHIAVITLDQIIETLGELYFRLKWDPEEKEQGLTNCMTFISGPSKTGDIELVMVHGAHGPRRVIVYVITG